VGITAEEDLSAPDFGPVKELRGLFTRFVALLGQWELADLDDGQRQRIVRGLFHDGPRLIRFARRFAALMTLSVLIAVMGLLADSTAVVIGAMLVAPLMSPVLGAAAALVLGWPRKFLRQLTISAIGSIGAIGLAAATSFIVPWNPDPLPAEVLARTSPNLLDLGIALAAGAAGAYAQVRRAASDALTGVAVAVALVPPLAVVGICLELQQWDLALGAFLLFLANVAGIIMSAAVTFLICGLVPGRRLQAGSSLIAAGVRWSTVAVILPLHFTHGQVLPPSDPTEEIEFSLDQFVEDGPSASELMAVSVEQGDRALLVDVILTNSPSMPGAADLANHLAEEFYELVSVRMQVVEVSTDLASAGE
jgi:uncharacterized hydrophobic protein (TIGR00271 family)